MVLPSKDSPELTLFNKPASDAAEAGSQKMPSSDANLRYVLRISSSLTLSMRPFDSSRAFKANSQLAGLPIRIADATVRGSSTMAPSTIGAAPDA